MLWMASRQSPGVESTVDADEALARRLQAEEEAAATPAWPGPAVESAVEAAGVTDSGAAVLSDEEYAKLLQRQEEQPEASSQNAGQGAANEMGLTDEQLARMLQEQEERTPRAADAGQSRRLLQRFRPQMPQFSGGAAPSCAACWPIVGSFVSSGAFFGCCAGWRRGFAQSEGLSQAMRLAMIHDPSQQTSRRESRRIRTTIAMRMRKTTTVEASITMSSMVTRWAMSSTQLRLRQKPRVAMMITASAWSAWSNLSRATTCDPCRACIGIISAASMSGLQGAQSAPSASETSLRCRRRPRDTILPAGLASPPGCSEAVLGDDAPREAQLLH
eukprot:TRINITY_DN19876_c0_g1_i2.p1 TRINITY_DN19876_c0_g1~~TRINITY_DN19876_c0_g1_i2.p1  ORF type:complete len:331 (+),score=61.77 TRINITY_DN19876_c0_g1_i2:71-1063(+)